MDLSDKKMQSSAQAVHENIRFDSFNGISCFFCTRYDAYEPFHWHEAAEILFYLNGSPDISIDGVHYPLALRQAVFINPGQVHMTHSRETPMFLCIHLDENIIQTCLPETQLHPVWCIPGHIPDKKQEEYQKICSLLERMTRLYMENADFFSMEASGLALQVYALMQRHFSQKETPDHKRADNQARERIRSVIDYVQEHFKEPVSLDDICGFVNLNREYFCRFFKKYMGMTFLQYLNEVRITHIYHDLLQTDRNVAQIAEENGFLNLKLFYREFRKIYGCTPMEVRKGG